MDSSSSRGAVQKPRWWRWGLAAILVLFLLIAAYFHLLLFKNTDTRYEATLRSVISSSFREILNLDINDFDHPVAVNQDVLYQEPLVALTDKITYQANQTIRLEIAHTAPVKIAISTGLEYGQRKRVIPIETSSGTSKPNLLMFNSLKGFSDSKFEQIDISAGQFESGWSQIEVRQGGILRQIPVLVESKQKLHDVLFVESTYTLAAYNSAPQFRTNYSNPKNLSGAFTRPQTYPMNYEISKVGESNPPSCSDHLINADLRIKALMGDLGYSYDVISDATISKEGVPSGYRLVVFGAHAEYWSQGMYRAATEFADNGGSILYFGGNTAWRSVEETGEGYDIYWGNGQLTTEKQDFINEYLGSYYDMRGYGTTAGFETTSDIQLISRATKSDEKFGTKLPKYCDASVIGSSGSETDKKFASAHEFKVLAQGQNAFGGGAQTVFRQLDSGGYILNMASTGAWLSYKDPVTQEIVLGFLEKSVTGS